jgi:hypothetical protein
VEEREFDPMSGEADQDLITNCLLYQLNQFGLVRVLYWRILPQLTKSIFHFERHQNDLMRIQFFNLIFATYWFFEKSNP